MSFRYDSQDYQSFQDVVSWPVEVAEASVSAAMAEYERRNMVAEMDVWTDIIRSRRPLRQRVYWAIQDTFAYAAMFIAGMAVAAVIAERI